MKHLDFKTLLAILLLSLALPAITLPALAHEGHDENAESAFASIFHHYEALWQALAADSQDGVLGHAEGILEAADKVTADFSLERAGLVNDADVEKATSAFDEIAKAALLLSSATDLATARELFYEISKPMVRLNGMLAGERMKVVYCSMAKKSWLQREEKIANPYHGEAMGGCGEVVS